MSGDKPKNPRILSALIFAIILVRYFTHTFI
jgi:hypothetical protein